MLHRYPQVFGELLEGRIGFAQRAGIVILRLIGRDDFRGGFGTCSQD